MIDGAKEATSVAIREATPGDLLSILALLEESKLPTVGVREALNGFLVAERAAEGLTQKDDSIIGVIGIEACGAEYGLLRSAAVASDWQGLGIGRALTERAIALATARGYRAVYLLTTTAERYFPTFGFAAISRDQVPDAVRATDEFRGACPASATVMTRSLSDR